MSATKEESAPVRIKTETQEWNGFDAKKKSFDSFMQAIMQKVGQGPQDYDRRYPGLNNGKRLRISIPSTRIEITDIRTEVTEELPDRLSALSAWATDIITITARKLLTISNEVFVDEMTKDKL